MAELDAFLAVHAGGAIRGRVLAAEAGFLR